MPTYSKVPLSESNNGRGILISAGGSPGTLVHSGVAGTSALDEVWIWAINHATGTPTGHCIIQYGDTISGVATNNRLTYAESLALMIPGYLIQNGQLIRAYAEPSGNVSIFGFVNRIS